LAQKSEGRLMVGFNRRFAPDIIKVKEVFKNASPLTIICRINAGAVPKDHWTQDPKEGGGRIIGEVCHFVDLCQFVANSFPAKVYTSLMPKGGVIQTNDNVVATIDFKNGSQGIIIYNSFGPETLPKEQIEILGASKATVIDNFKSSVIYDQSGRKKISRFGQDKGHFNELVSLIEAIRHGKPSPISLKEIVLSTQTTFDLIKSAKEKRFIEIANLWD